MKKIQKLRYSDINTYIYVHSLKKILKKALIRTFRTSFLTKKFQSTQPQIFKCYFVVKIHI